MASLRPSLPRSGGYKSSQDLKKESIRPSKSEHRSRSTSGAAKPYNPDTPRRYVPNESRTRKPPPSPSLEDGGFGDDGVQMRGKLDQQPMIIPTGSDSSSSHDGSLPLTPDDSVVENVIHIPADDIDIRQAHNVIRASCSKPSDLSDRRGNQEGHRGRRDVPRLDTDSERKVSSHGAPLRLERERSPYAHPPSELSKSKENRLSGDYLQSPDVLSPRVQSSGGHRPPSQRPQPHRHETYDGHSSTRSGLNKESVKGLGRPAIDPRVSAMPTLGSPTFASAHRSRYRNDHHISSDESETDIAHQRARSGRYTSDAASRPSTSYFDGSRQKEGHFSSSNQPPQSSPPQTPTSTGYAKATPLNQDTLLHGPGLQHLTTLLEGHDINHRRASPRPSPHPSPRPSPPASPLRSPPATPPEHHTRRSHPIEILKRESPKSKPSSPLSSAPSSPRPSALTYNSRHMDQDHGHPSTSQKSSRNSSSRYIPTDGSDLPVAPKVDVRGPSPAPAPTRHSKSSSYDKDETRAQPLRQQTYNALGVPGEPTLRPARSGQRPRSVSNAETRGPRPNLSIKPPAVHQNLENPLSPSQRYMPSPGYPLSPSQTPKSSLLSPDGSHGSSRPAVTDDGSSHHRHRSRSSTGRSSHYRHRSRSSVDPNAAMAVTPSAPAPKVAFSDQVHAAGMPLCPVSDTGLDEWYTVDRHTKITICPDCRRNIFGTVYEGYLQPQSDSRQSKRPRCSMNDPWTRLACLVTFDKKRKDLKLLTDLADVAADELCCPESSPVDDRDWYHLCDSGTQEAFSSFPVCAHCRWSLDVIFPVLGDMFHRSRDLPKEARVCALRSDGARFGKYLNRLSAMAQEAKESGQKPATGDFIWEVKWMTVISPCRGDQVLAGHDWHIHPELPLLTVCEECYYTTVRPQIRTRSRIASEISPTAYEVTRGVSCKLYSPRMKQIFEMACRERDFEDLKRAVEKRHLLQQDLIEAQTRVQRNARDREAVVEVEKLMDRWKKFEKKHED